MLIFVWSLEYLIKKLPVPTKRATVISIKVKSCDALLHMLLVRTIIYLKSVEVAIFNFGDRSSAHTTCTVREQRYENSWLFFEDKRRPRAKTFGKHCWTLIDQNV